MLNSCTVIALFFIVFMFYTKTTQAQQITCFGQEATIVGSPQADNIIGTSGDDIIVTLGGNDFADEEWEYIQEVIDVFNKEAY